MTFGLGIVMMCLWGAIFVYFNMKVILSDYSKIFLKAFLLVMVYAFLVVIGFGVGYLTLWAHDLGNLVSQYRNIYPHTDNLGAHIPSTTDFEHFTGFTWGDVYHHSPIFSVPWTMFLVSAYSFIGASYNGVSLAGTWNLLSLLEMVIGLIFPAIFIAIFVSKATDDSKDKDPKAEEVLTDIHILLFYLNQKWVIKDVTEVGESLLSFVLSAPDGKLNFLTLGNTPSIQKFLRDINYALRPRARKKRYRKSINVRY